LENFYETNVLHDDLIKKRDWQWKQDKRSSLNEQDDELLKVIVDLKQISYGTLFSNRVFLDQEKIEVNQRNKQV
jgi:hypothetical protein